MDGPWFIENGKQNEAALCAEAVKEINRLESEVERMRAEIKESLAPYRERLSAASQSYEEARRHIWANAEKVRNAAKGLVTQIDKVKESAPAIEHEGEYLT